MYSAITGSLSRHSRLAARQVSVAAGELSGRARNAVPGQPGRAELLASTKQHLQQQEQAVPLAVLLLSCLLS